MLHSLSPVTQSVLSFVDVDVLRSLSDGGRLADFFGGAGNGFADCCAVKLNTLPLKKRERLTGTPCPSVLGGFRECSPFSGDDDSSSSLSAATSRGSTAGVGVVQRSGVLGSERTGADITMSS